MVNSMDKNLTVPAESSFTVDQEIYTAARGYVVAAQNQIYSSVNIAAVLSYVSKSERTAFQFLPFSFSMP